jgi:hypothetical protein
MVVFAIPFGFSALQLAAGLLATSGTIYIAREKIQEIVGGALGLGGDRTPTERDNYLKAVVSGDKAAQDFAKNAYEDSLRSKGFGDDRRLIELTNLENEGKDYRRLADKLPEGTNPTQAFAIVEKQRAAEIGESAKPTTTREEQLANLPFEKKVEAQQFTEGSLGSKFTPEAANTLLAATAGLQRPIPAELEALPEFKSTIKETTETRTAKDVLLGKNKPASPVGEPSKPEQSTETRTAKDVLMQRNIRKGQRRKII